MWIGPTECNKERTARNKDVEEVWSRLASIKGYRETYLLFTSAVDLFREALSCYQNGAYMATVLMCRACVEASIYIITSREVKYRSNLRMVHEVKMNYDLIRAKWKCIMCKARENGYIDDELEQRIKQIREAGNFAAHYGQRFDEELKSIKVRETERIKGWTRKEDALNILHVTVNVLERLMTNILQKAQ